MRPYILLMMLMFAEAGFSQDPTSERPSSLTPVPTSSSGAISAAVSQDSSSTSHGKSAIWDYFPRPYVFAGPSLMGAGYAPLAYSAGVGVRIDADHLLFDARAVYDNAHKANDGTGHNAKGHDRGLRGSLYYRLPSGWAFGGGAGWGQLSTTNYTKSAWRPRFGGSKDFFTSECRERGCRNDFTMRLGADYLMKGSDWQNGVQGVEMNFYLPSPSAKRHLFWRQTIGIYRFYDTVTDRNNRYLTRLQMSKHHADSFLDFAVMYRF